MTLETTTRSTHDSIKHTEKQRVIFCDFDGTITANDNIVAIMKHFQPPGWKELVKQVVSRQISVRQGVGAMFRLLPSHMEKEITEFSIQNAVIREGFTEFINYCKLNNIILLITSGGIDFFLYPILEPFDIAHEQIFCNASSFKEDTIEILWPHACDANCDNDCGMCKTTIIRSYPASEYTRILIGDSVTDFAGAKLVDTIYARAQLIDLCKESQLEYIPFDNFHEIIGSLEVRLER
ncbi:2-hydroxy-3-keto-5-methylthiopentenyl-1-phosphate phosphatase [Paenibacillus albiflavus]|uniref:2-hydroxy-3-keto-5-methylthiopentenyl-1-phosphate phosphatase n=1 Tax=Paenibacillus albiflavus TaxID=2545760 RepID=A0A4R4ELL6_9BACL|nr:2-hydroxy-3-keto-5-methylthiopentenyl-1-phosphate phosphatase [Paenibacillus albiflavus]TCZ81166.1 2-hydroxy-3-keto-5-methylthiopentenyl-1-phosphate phosphatase [Paenibacillus albiflavus]